MLRVKNISKTYATGDLVHKALDDVSLDLRDSEFVAILGPSGSGKTTLLNIVGGLDRYDSGDLVINGVSTREYKDRDWDAYRNHTVGFVFQSYNLIPHQSVLANVELALTISGVSRAQRKERAARALEAVGLGEQLHKRPNQLSGGQMQRVAIARALVNDPDIVLADEPTGALDTETSITIMNLLKEVAKDRLVVMVTHNPELAQEYATRIISLRDGHIEGDTDPFRPMESALDPVAPGKGRVSMSFLTALPLSFSNLLTKKGRTLLTSFAGSIGIIGIALVLSLSNGVNSYIGDIERDTMGSYPIELERETINIRSMEEAGGSGKEEGKAHGLEAIYSNNVVGDTVSATKDLTATNNLSAFKRYYEANSAQLDGAVSAVEYGYGITPQVYRLTDGGAEQASPVTIGSEGSQSQMSMFSSSNSTAWVQLPRNEQLQRSSYELLAGSWPQSSDEVALVISGDNEVSDLVLYTIGLMDKGHMEDVIRAAENGEEIDDPQRRFTYDEALGLEFKVLAPCQLYYEEGGVWVDGSDDGDFVAERSATGGKSVRVAAILRAGDNADISSGVVYTAALTDELISLTSESDVVKAQLSDPDVNVLTGEPFDVEDNGDKGSSSSGSGGSGPSASTVSYRGVSSPIAGGAAMTASCDTPAGVSHSSGISDATSAIYHPAPSKDQPYEGDSLNVLSLAAARVDGGEEESPEMFTVTFKNYDGSTLLGAKEYAKGDNIAAFPEETPRRATDAAYEYVFIGWKSSTNKGVYTTADLPAVTETVEYVAFYYAKQAAATPAAPTTGMPDSTIPEGMSSTDYSGMPGMSGMSGADMSSFTSSSQMELTDAQLAVMIARASDSTPSTYEDVMEALGYVTADDPSSIKLYPSDFDNKQKVEDFIAAYNDQAPEADRVTYTDMVGLMVSSITSIVDIISYVLIAFVAVSLAVSCIMIGIITYISVLERKKEIGILRAMGASRRNVSQVFNAETFIIGALSGLLGIGVTLLLLVPTNVIIHAVTGVENVSASLPALYAAILVALSIVLTLAGGLIPAKSAAKRDPVVALRSE